MGVADDWELQDHLPSLVNFLSFNSLGMLHPISMVMSKRLTVTTLIKRDVGIWMIPEDTYFEAPSKK